jgi:uncharacterized membrane protein
VGALAGHLANYGIGREFIEQVREALKTAPKFEIVASNLSHEQEEKLKAAFAG